MESGVKNQTAERRLEAAFRDTPGLQRLTRPAEICSDRLAKNRNHRRRCSQTAGIRSRPASGWNLNAEPKARSESARLRQGVVTKRHTSKKQRKSDCWWRHYPSFHASFILKNGASQVNSRPQTCEEARDTVRLANTDQFHDSTSVATKSTYKNTQLPQFKGETFPTILLPNQHSEQILYLLRQMPISMPTNSSAQIFKCFPLWKCVILGSDTLNWSAIASGRPC